MANLKNIAVTLQVFTHGTWTTCEEFEFSESLKDNANSGTKFATCVECVPGRFRFVVTLSKFFTWADDTNALSIDLTFDEGDPINEYRTVVLNPEALDPTEQLGLGTMAHNSSGGLTYCLDTIAMPMEADNSSSPWFRTSFEFERHRRDFNAGARRSMYKGKLKVDVVPCIAKSSSSRRACIALKSKLERKWRELPPRDSVTLMPVLKYDTSQGRGSSCHHKCQFIKHIEPISFTFFYREQGHYEKIPEENIDIIPSRTPYTAATQSEDRWGGRQTSIKAAVLATSSEISSTNKSFENGSHQPSCLPESSLTTPVPGSPTENVHADSIHDEAVEDSKLIPSAVKTDKIKALIDHARREQWQAERAAVQERRESLTNELANAQAVLEMAQDQLRKLRREDDHLRDTHERLDKQLGSTSEHIIEDDFEAEDRKRLAVVQDAMQSLYDHRHNKLESLGRLKSTKRRRTS